MESIRFVCPHCGLKMEATLQGKPSLLMVFLCARCKAPLMRFDGEVFELDRAEFANLRKKLSPVIGQLLRDASKDKPSISDEAMRELMENLDCADVSEFIDKM